MADDILKELLKLESLSNPSSSSKSKSKPLQTTLSDLELALEIAESQIKDGIDVQDVVESLIKETESKRVDVDKGLKEWYGGLSKVGKAIDKGIVSDIAAISNTYDLPAPPLFSSETSRRAMDGVILETMVRKGAWNAAEMLCRETGMVFDEEMRRLSEELHATIGDMMKGDVESALKWTSKHHDFLSAPPHPSPLIFYLHRARLIQLLLTPSANTNPHSDCPAPLQYARDHLFPYVVSSHQQEIYHLLGALLYTPSQLPTSPYADLLSPSLQPPALVPLFRVEFCRLHGWAREDPLSVVVDLGASGALGKIDKARKVMKERLGEVRTWDELPMELPVPLSRRYHSVFACPVSKEQATEANPPKMLSCGHTIAQDSLTKLSKHGRRAVKCPYCPQETAIASALRLYM